jgi:putative ABC transport system permease protein
MFPNFGIDPDTVPAMWPDYQITPPGAVAAFRKTRNGALVGEDTFKKFGWRVGQEVTLRGTIFPVDLTFMILGTIRSRSGNAVLFWFNRKYLEEAMEPRGGLRGVGMIWLHARRPEDVDPIIHAVDELFRNSEAEVAAETEKAFFASFFSSFQGMMRVILAVGFLVVGAVVLIAANTSAMGVRERIPEIAMLKSLGFQRRPLLLTLMAESMLQALLGGMLGAGGAFVIFRALAAAGKTGGGMPFLGPLASFNISPAVVGQGVAIALAVGLGAGAIPAWNGARLNVVEALRRLF